MGFHNQKNYIISDSLGNIHYFYWENGEISLVKYKQSEESIKKIIAENCNIEFDITIDESDTIYLLCQKDNGSLVLYYHENGVWSENILAEEFSYKIFNLNLITIENNLHFVYCINTEESLYKAFHHYIYDNQWVTKEIGSIKTKLVLNHFNLIKDNDDILIIYYDLTQEGEQIFIKRFNLDDGNWSSSIKITDSQNDKLYLDIIKDNEGNFNISYSEYIDGNFEIVHKKFSLYNNYAKNIYESKISNPSNSSYPTIVYFKGKMWISWIEYNHLVSCFSENLGETWSNPYLWKESRKDNFLRYRYLANRNSENNLSYSFGKEPPNLSFMGFGTLENTEEIPLIDKKKEELDSNTGNIVIDKSFNKRNDYKDINKKYVISKESNDVRIELENFKEDIDKKVIDIVNRLEKLEKQVFRRRKPF